MSRATRLAKLQDRVRPYLHSDESLTLALPAQAGWAPPTLAPVLGAVLMWFSFPLLFTFLRPRILVFTDRSLLTLKADFLTERIPRRIKERSALPRAIEWRRGLVAGKLRLDGKKFYIYRHHFGEIEKLCEQLMSG